MQPLMLHLMNIYMWYFAYADSPDGPAKLPPEEVAQGILDEIIENVVEGMAIRRLVHDTTVKPLI